MDPDYYVEMHENEDRHWWFVARRRIVGKILDRFVTQCGGRVLEAGCGTGGNLELLARYGTMHALELDENARKLANERDVCEVQGGRLPDDIPFEGEFDLICALDVLEHVEDDAAAARALGEKLVAGGKLLLTVPAYRCLWSHHDVITHHQRRYVRSELIERVEGAGLEVRCATYFNTFLFPIVWLVRLVKKALGREEGSDFSIHSTLVNGLLTAVFSAERLLVPWLRLPFGVSILVLAEKPAAPADGPPS